MYRRWEDIMRNKWTWDRVARGTHGTNCTGNCAFNVYVRNGIVWREEQQDESLPAYRPPVTIKDHPLHMLMGHARHGIHSMWRDDSLLLSLQRGEPDIYVSVEDSKARGVSDGDLIKIFNTAGYFIANAHVSSGIQPGMTFMYHGWDPMMFEDRQNFGAVVASAGLIKPTSLISGYGHITHRPFAFEPNAIFADFTCDFELHEARAAA